MHRCGRAGRKQVLSGEASQYPPTVYSFFNRELKAMADSVVELLKACNSSFIDPNLLALTSGAKNDSAKSSNGRRKRKRKGGTNNDDDAEDSSTKAGKAAVNGDDGDSDADNDQFAFLGKSRALKRASHVSDAEDSDDSDN